MSFGLFLAEQASWDYLGVSGQAILNRNSGVAPGRFKLLVLLTRLIAGSVYQAVSA